MSMVNYRGILYLRQSYSLVEMEAPYITFNTRQDAELQMKSYDDTAPVQRRIVVYYRKCK